MTAEADSNPTPVASRATDSALAEARFYLGDFFP